MTSHMMTLVHQTEKLFEGLQHWSWTGIKVVQAISERVQKKSLIVHILQMSTCLSTHGVKPSDCYFVNLIE